MTKMAKRYRLVSDYGYGDKTWLQRDLEEQEAIRAWMKAMDWYGENNPPDIELCMDTDFRYYLEEDHPEDQEDWDWQSS